MEYQNVTKSVIKVIKQLLEFTSRDESRAALFFSVKVEKGVVKACDGFRLAYLKLNEELQKVFCEDGVFTVHEGRIFYSPVVAMEKTDVTFPELKSVMPKGEIHARFGINPTLLIDALKYANTNSPVEFIIYKYENMKPSEQITTPIELRYSVGDSAFDTAIMPMSISDKSSNWSYNNENDNSNSQG